MNQSSTAGESSEVIWSIVANLWHRDSDSIFKKFRDKPSMTPVADGEGWSLKALQHRLRAVSEDVQPVPCFQRIEPTEDLREEPRAVRIVGEPHHVGGGRERLEGLVPSGHAARVAPAYDDAAWAGVCEVAGGFHGLDQPVEAREREGGSVVGKVGVVGSDGLGG